MERRGRRRASGTMISAMIAVAVAASPSHASPTPDAPLRPAVGVLFGAYVDPDARWTGVEDAKAEVATFEQQIGRRLDVDHHYYGWTQSFPGPLEKWDAAEGRIPLISWHGTNLDEILSGADDALIRARADSVKAFRIPLFLSWGWEPNGDWYSWSGAQNNDSGRTNGPAKYVAAWRHIHDLFAQEGATNAVWVWRVSHESEPDASWNAVSKYYPGDKYVDWVGIDGYNWGDTKSWSTWTSFSDLFGPVYDLYGSSKPVMIGETSSVESGGSKAAWIADAMAQIQTRFPNIAAFLWFDANKEEDWRADSTTTSFEVYRIMGANPYFNQRLPDHRATTP